MIETMKRSSVARTVLVSMFTACVTAVGSAQGSGVDKRPILTAAIRAVANPTPAKPDDLILSTRIGAVEDEKTAKSIAAELGGRARSRVNRFVCSEDAEDPRRKPICRVEAGQQFVEILGVEHSNTTTLVNVRVDTNTRRGSKMELFRVILVPQGHAWRVQSTELVAIS